jgi:hypothetical protein
MRHESSELGYSIGHPHDWDPFEERGELVYDSFIAPLGEQLDVYRVDLDLEGQVPLNAWLAEFRALAVNDWGYEAAPPTEVEVAGLPGRQMPFSGEDESGSVYGIYAVSQVSPSVVFEFVLWGLPDEKGNARELMDGFLATFVPSGS